MFITINYNIAYLQISGATRLLITKLTKVYC